MSQSLPPLEVFYDAACPRCRKDRVRYEKLAGKYAHNILWLDANTHQQKMAELDIDYHAALLALHIYRPDINEVYKELDAYDLLLGRVPWLKPLGWLFRIPVIRPVLAKWYHHWVVKRLCQQGRMPREG
ncbi:hypothetical protein HMF8227_01538 [Saliniradius amylolyticus]|uniref:DUF393 domain-containing protein n=1 Tax=Saliniradius amylolyticus TaxID=2183582 RepID=A0A2S2E3B5_9ALTE|nr:DCC1-like thiol-disulfide oxidoreductase family protein [Saliniradius amylolyticus]AWL12012.1 hypothetical protein HMF8227_01538 [Saliniradius amylolyticus]